MIARAQGRAYMPRAMSPTNTVNSRLVDTPLLRRLAISDKIQIPIYSGLTENDSWCYGLSLFRTQNDVPMVSDIMRVDCIYTKFYHRWLMSVFVAQSVRRCTDEDLAGLYRGS